MKKVGLFILSLMILSSFVFAEVYESETEVSINLAEEKSKNPIFDLFLSKLTGKVVAQNSCGQLGASKGYQQRDLSCQAKSCPTGFTNLGSTYDCKACCAKTSSGSSSNSVSSNIKCDFGKSGSREFWNRHNTKHYQDIYNRYGKDGAKFRATDCVGYYLKKDIRNFVDERRACGYKVSLSFTTNGGSGEWCTVKWRK